MKRVLNELNETLETVVARLKKDRVSLKHAAAYARYLSTSFQMTQRADRDHLAAFYLTVARLIESDDQDATATA